MNVTPNPPHSSLNDITPNDAISDPKKRTHAMHLNLLKGEQNGFTNDKKSGDKVRIDDTALFKKGTDNRWSDEIYIVESATGKIDHLTYGQRLRRDKVFIAQS